MIIGLLEKYSIKNRPSFFTLVFSIIIFFALAYMACDWFEPNDKDNNTSMFAYNAVKNDTIGRKILNKIYVSISTLTTLGYGDMYPRHPISQTLVAIQTFITFMLVSDLAIN